MKSFIIKDYKYLLLSRRLTNLFDIKTQYNLIMEGSDKKFSRSNINRLFFNNQFLSLDFYEQKTLFLKIMEYILNSYD